MFVPFLIVDPKAEIPVVMLSLRKDLDPAFHIKLGKALEPLRDEGVAIVGSGMSFHDLRHFPRRRHERLGRLRRLARRDGEGAAGRARGAARRLGQGALGARSCHPREEHLLPLMVVAGAAGDSQGKRDFNDKIGGKMISGFRFG